MLDPGPASTVPAVLTTRLHWQNLPVRWRVLQGIVEVAWHQGTVAMGLYFLPPKTIVQTSRPVEYLHRSKLTIRYDLPVVRLLLLGLEK